MLEINSEKSLRDWLEARPEATRHQEAVIISSRAAARVLPNIFSQLHKSEPWQTTLTFSGFRAIAAARLFALVPSRAAQEAADSAAFSAHFAANSAADSASWTAANVATSAAFSARSAGDALSADFAATSAAFSAFSAAWAAINRDAAMIEEQGAAKILLAPLPFLTWNDLDQDKQVKQSIALGWAELKTFYLAQPNEDWQVWIDWYERIVAGTSSPRAIEEAYVFLDDPKLWDQGPALANHAIKEKLEEVRVPKPIPNLPSIVEFGWNKAGKIVVTAGSFNIPTLPFATSKKDHKNRLEVCKTLGNDLIADLKKQKYQVRSDYKDGLEKYLSRVPKKPRSGNIGLADAEFRALLTTFAAEAASLDNGFAARLKTFVEEHIALRAYYPSIEEFYISLRNGVLSAAAPTEAFDRFFSSIISNKKIFDQGARQTIGAVAETPPQIPKLDETPMSSETILPPKDPYGEIDIISAADKAKGGVANRLWDVLIKGKKVHEGVEGWEKTVTDLAPYFEKIRQWILSGKVGNPPDFPPTFGA